MITHKTHKHSKIIPKNAFTANKRELYLIGDRKIAAKGLAAKELWGRKISGGADYANVAQIPTLL